jgi:hypothetical protein
VKTLNTHIDIHAPAGAVWEVLTDLERYAEWNPFIVEAAGKVAVGACLTVRVKPVGGRATAFRPTVTAADPERRFAWLGRLWGVPGLFDGAHRFELQADGDRTRLVQAEDFRGVLVPLFAGSLETGSRAGFEAMNVALARRAEDLAARSR